jgi:hypothetical protein
MLRSLARLRDSAGCLLLTLTYPAVWALDGVTWKRDKAAFERRLERAFPKAGWYWRLEYQRRGAPHYHLLVFGVDFIAHEWLARAWYEVVGSGDADHLRAGTSIERVRSGRGVRRYAAKYVAKVAPEWEQLFKDESGFDYRHVGRWWGLRHPENLPLGECLTVTLSEGEAVRVRRFMRRYLAHVARLQLRCGLTSAALFCNAGRVWGALPQLIC